jgi:hypothetical protein
MKEFNATKTYVVVLEVKIHSSLQTRSAQRTGNPHHSHILACQSPPPVARYPPNGLNPIESTELLCPCIIQCGTPVLEFQNMTPQSLELDTAHFPSCADATDST